MHWRIGLLATVAILAVVIVIAAALRVRNLPVALSAPTSIPASTPAPTVAAQLPEVITPAALAHPALLNVEQSILIALPTGWQQLNLDAVDLQDRLQTVILTTTDAADLSALLLSNAGGEAVVATATLVDARRASTPAAVTISAVARNGLTLEGYLTSVERTLVARGVQVHDTYLDGSLRSDGLPVATMHYTLPAQEVDAYQVIAYDAPATRLIVFTFTVPTKHYTDLLPKFHEVVRSTTF